MVNLTIWQNLGKKLWKTAVGLFWLRYMGLFFKLHLSQRPEEAQSNSAETVVLNLWFTSFVTNCKFCLMTTSMVPLWRSSTSPGWSGSMSCCRAVVCVAADWPHCSTGRHPRRWPLHPHHNHKVWAKNWQGLFSLTLSTLTSSNQLPFTLESPSIYSLQDLEAGLNNNIFMSLGMHKAISVQTNLNWSCKYPPLTQITQEELIFMSVVCEYICVDSSQISEVPNMRRGPGVARRLHINVRLNLLDILLLTNHFLDHCPWLMPRWLLQLTLLTQWRIDLWSYHSLKTDSFSVSSWLWMSHCCTWGKGTSVVSCFSLSSFIRSLTQLIKVHHLPGWALAQGQFPATASHRR